MSRSHVDLCKAEHLIRPIAPLGQTQPLEPTVVQQMWREYVANTSLFERSLIQVSIESLGTNATAMKYFSENPHQVVANAWHQCSNLIAFTSRQCSKKPCNLSAKWPGLCPGALANCTGGQNMRSLGQ